MARAVHLVLLGTPGLWLDGRPASPVTRRLLSILALLHEEGCMTRAGVATMLWGDREDEAALHNLRQELYRLSKVAPGAVVAQGKTLCLAPHVTSDVRAAGEDAVEILPRGEFLQGITDDDEAFCEWLAARRAHHDRARIARLRASGREQDLELALAIDPLREDVWRDLLELLAAAGRHDEVAVAYGRLGEALSAGLGVEPLPETRELFERLRAPAPNSLSRAEATLRAAVDLQRRHRHDEVIETLRGSLAELGDEVPEHRPLVARLVDVLFESAAAGRRFDVMEEGVNRLRALARLDLSFDGVCQTRTAALWYKQARFAEVRDFTREAWSERGHRDDLAEILVWRGLAFMRLGDLAAAHEVLTHATASPLPVAVEAEALSGLGTVALNAGRRAEAAERLTAALRLAREAGSVVLTVQARANLGVLHLIGGEHEAAAQTLTRAIEDARALSQPAMTRALLLNLFKARYELGDFEAAQDTLAQAFVTLRDAPDPLIEGVMLNHRAVLARARGDYNSALGALEAALERARTNGNKTQVANRHLARADMLLELGAVTEAHEDLGEARALIERNGLREIEPWAHLLAADAALQLDNFATCAASLGEVALVKESLTPDDVSRLHCISAAAALKRGDADAALAALADPPDATFRARHLALRAGAKQMAGLDVSREREEARGLLASARLIALDEVRLRRVLHLEPARAAEVQRRVAEGLAASPSIRQAFERRWQTVSPLVPV